MSRSIRQPGLKNGGFTLVELLVSIGLLVLMIIMVTQLTNSTGTTVGNSGKHMDADTQARLIFNRMSVDIARMVKRTDLDYSSFKHPVGTYILQTGTTVPPAMPANDQTGGSDQMAFYSESDGYFSGNLTPSGTQKSTVSLVAYFIANDPYSGQPVLRRMGKGLGWEPSSTSGGWANVAYLPYTLAAWYTQINPGHTLFEATSSSSDADYKTVGDQVFRFEYNYLLKSTSTQQAKLSITPWDSTATPISHTAINGFKDVAAIVVTLGVLDTTSRRIVKDYSKLTDNSIFTDVQEGLDVAQAWNAAVESPNFAGLVGIPKPSAAAVRIYQRYFYLDTPTP